MTLVKIPEGGLRRQYGLTAHSSVHAPKILEGGLGNRCRQSHNAHREGFEANSECTAARSSECIQATAMNALKLPGGRLSPAS